MNRPEDQFADVYRAHVGYVYGFLAYRTRSPDLADDLTQSTFERALRAWSRFDARKGSERTWLLAIARNQLIDHARRDRAELIATIDDRMLSGADFSEPESGASQEVLDALATLADRDREVIALRFGGDLTGPEIAELLDLSVGNVQQILSRSLRKLRVILTSERS